MMSSFLTPETFNVLCEISAINKKITDKWPFKYLKTVFDYLFVIKLIHHMILSKIDLLFSLQDVVTVNFFTSLKVSVRDCYFVFF